MIFKKLICLVRPGIVNRNSQINAMILQSLSMGMSFLTVFILSLAHNFEIVGKFVLLLTIQQIAGFIFTFGVSSYSIRVLNRTNRIPDIIWLLIFHTFTILLIFIVICWYINLYYVNHFDIAVSLTIITWLGLARYVLEDITAGLRWFSWGGLINFSETFTRLILTLFVEMYSDFHIIEVLSISTLTAISIFGIPVLIKINIFNKIKLNFKFISIFYKKSAIMYISHMCALLQGRFPILIAPNFLSSKEVGLFALTLSLSEISLRLGNMTSKYALSISSKKGLYTFKIGNSSIIKYVILTSIVIIIILALSFPYIDSKFYGGDLKNMESSFLILLLYSFLFLYFNITSNIIYGLGKSEKVILSSLYGLLFSGLLIIILNPNSVELLCIAMVCGAATSCISNSFIIRRM